MPPPTNTLVAGGIPPSTGALDVGAHGVEVVADEVRPVGPRGERAVVAPRRAERDVDVDAERLASPSAGHHQRRRRRRRPSRPAARGGRATTRSAASASSSGVQPPSGPMATVVSAGASGRPPGSATTAPGSTSARRDRPADVGQPHPPRLHRRLGGDPPQPVELAGGPVAVPAHDRPFGVEQRRCGRRRPRCTSAPASRGGRPSAGRRRPSSVARRRARSTTSPSGSERRRRSSRHGRQRPAPVGDRDRLAVAEPQHAAEVVRRRRRRAPGAATSATSTWAAERRSALVHRRDATRTPT